MSKDIKNCNHNENIQDMPKQMEADESEAIESRLLKHL